MQPQYGYQFAALLRGDYTLALMCQSTQDNRAQADFPVTFSPVITGIALTADHTALANISQLPAGRPDPHRITAS